MAQLYVSPYILELLTDFIKAEDSDTNYYKELSQKLPFTQESTILREISLDDAKHYKMLNDIYYKLMGERLEPPLKGEVLDIGSDIAKEYEKAILSKLQKSEEYRKILFAFLNQEIRDLMLEIITDEQNHAAKLNYLYTKMLGK